MTKTYRRKINGKIWKLVWKHVAAWAPYELRGEGTTRYLTDGELHDEYEFVADV